jgi:hypothetical protein
MSRSEAVRERPFAVTTGRSPPEATISRIMVTFMRILFSYH